MRADLHLHSVYSDGLNSPDEICRLAKARGVELISVTDHDTLAGLDVKMEAAKRHGLAYLSGWEISAYQGGEKIHVLGYGCEMGEAYKAFNEKRKQASFARAEDCVKKFNALGIPLRLQEVLDRRSAPDLPVHTMHIARAAAVYLGIDGGAVYREYLARGKAANSNIGRPTPEEAIDCIHAAGGFASIAHPGRIELPDAEKEKLIISLADYGADGIESFYTTHTAKETAYFAELGERLGLLSTGGSDTHYEDETHTIGAPTFTPSEKLLEKLRIIY